MNVPRLYPALLWHLLLQTKDIYIAELTCCRKNLFPEVLEALKRGLSRASSISKDFAPELVSDGSSVISSWLLHCSHKVT